MPVRYVDFGGADPVAAGNELTFLGPAAATWGTSVMFWVHGGIVSPVAAAHRILRSHYADRRRFRVQPAEPRPFIYARMFYTEDADALHGKIYWVGDTRVLH
jgi:hypothetical protein